MTSKKSKNTTVTCTSRITGNKVEIPKNQINLLVEKGLINQPKEVEIPEILSENETEPKKA